MFAFWFIGYVMRKYKIPIAPACWAWSWGISRSSPCGGSLLLSLGDPMILISRPISLVLLSGALFSSILAAVQKTQNARRGLSWRTPMEPVTRTLAGFASGCRLTRWSRSSLRASSSTCWTPSAAAFTAPRSPGPGSSTICRGTAGNMRRDPVAAAVPGARCERGPGPWGDDPQLRFRRLPQCEGSSRRPGDPRGHGRRGGIGVSGRDVLTAMVAGYETMIRVSLATGPNASRLKGWHLTGTTGTFGAAAAAGGFLD